MNAQGLVFELRLFKDMHYAPISPKRVQAFLLLSCGCVVTMGVLWLFITVPWVGLQCVIVVFPDHTH